MEDWFKWILGGLVGLYSAVTGFVVGLILHDRKRLGELDRRLAVVETRIHVDPIVYMQDVTEIKAAIKALGVDQEEAANERREMLRLLRANRPERGPSR